MVKQKIMAAYEEYIEFKLAVETHLTDQGSVHAIAEQLATTTSTLYGVVKKFSGISPKEFITILWA